MFERNEYPFLAFLIAFSLLSYCNSLESVDFDTRTTGVGFSVYVKRTPKNGGAIPGWKTYSLADVKTMLEVISVKFSRITTFGVGADNVPYEWDVTYRDSNAQVLAAEAAAIINMQNNRLVLTMLVGMWQSDIPQQTETEVRLALECAQKANAIYQGTVQGLVFSQSDIHSNVKRARETLHHLKSIKANATRMGLKLGSRQQCYDITSAEDINETPNDKLTLFRRSIVNESDFIICEIFPANHNLPSGAAAGFITVQNDLLGFRHELRRINPTLDVMGQTGWASKGSNTWENIDNLREYWNVTSKWASLHNFTMWLIEAFDNPWKDWDAKSAHMGWWRLKDNDLIDSQEGYSEKVLEPPEEEPTTTSPWVYAGVAIGVIVVIVFFVLVLITRLFLRVQKLQETLTKEDVREFMYGISDEAAAQQDGAVIESALKFPYDKSYEITREKLKINRDALLGTGQFGCVYKALIQNKSDEDNSQIEVALKMAKSDCPKNALKGLLSEIKILTYLGKHPNIVSIQGAYTAEILNGIVYVATELCSLGSLENYLRKSQPSTDNSVYINAILTTDRYANNPTIKQENEETELITRPEITFFDMVRWSHEIACGMEYLGTKHVVHADLSTRNVLLASDKTAKITDFGLSRRLYDYTNYVKKQQEPLPWRWMAVESLKRLEFSAQSDVWSYGVTLWEIFAMGDLPYPGLSWNLEFVDSLVSGLRMKSPPHASPEIYDIMVSCWNLEPNGRPTFTSLKYSTSKIMSNNSPV